MIKNTALSVFLTVLGIFLFNVGFSQENTFKIIKKNNVQNISEYVEAMNNANFDAYRYIEKRRNIAFKSGVIIELLSAQELKRKNISFDFSKAKQYSAKEDVNYIFYIGNNGHIMAGVETKFNGKRYESK